MRTMRTSKAGLTMLMLLFMTFPWLVAGCDGDSSSTASSFIVPSTQNLPLPADQDTIAANFVMFFDGTRPSADKIGLLADGQQHAAELEALAASPTGPRISATISSVTVTSPTEAEVRYSIMLDGQPALAEQLSTVVLQDGEWKVSIATFQQLLSWVRGATPPSS
jgi:hypothetical protein